MAKEIRYISLMSELGAGTRGASLGFDSLRLASFDKDADFFNRYPIIRVPHYNEQLFRDYKDEYAIRLRYIFETFKQTTAAIGSELRAGRFPIVFSGDHSNAAGTIMAIKDALPKKRLGVIWIDAHADLHSPYTSPSGNVHGMPLAMSIAEDNQEKRINDPIASTVDIWNTIKGEEPRVSPGDLFFVAVRDTEAPEDHLMEKYSMPNITTEKLREIGPKAVAEKALQHLKDCDIIYISFDVDSMDPSISRGTGTPVPGGLSEEEATVLMQELVKSPKICCLETTEINPLLCDKGNAMAEATFDVIKPVIEEIEKN
tara:strand:+ start:105665 stop:106609 length:945 start_codon:yes stop_codon:yes gene_type:complete